MNYKIPDKFIQWIAEVMEMGALKHGDNNWKGVKGKKSSHKEMHDSMFHHLAESFGGNRTDDESGLDPLQHLATRALMCLYIKKFNIRND